MSSHGTGPLRKRKAPGVILARMPGRWDDEIRADGGKAVLHRQVRSRENRIWKREAALIVARGGAL